MGLALQFARRGKVRAVAALLDDAVEVLEVEATESGRLVKSDLANLGLPRGVLVAAIQRGDRILRPQGSDRIQPGDLVLFIATNAACSRLDTFLGE